VHIVTTWLNDELHRACADIAHGASGGYSGLTHLAPPLLAHAGCGCLFQHLLMAALHTAITLEQINAIALLVEEHLNLDMPWLLHIALDEHRVIAKAVDGLALARGQRIVKLIGTQHRAHALAPATGTGLDEHRVADASSLALEHSGVLIGAVVAGHERHAGFFHQLFGCRLEPHRANRAGGRADEGKARFLASLGKVFVLAQKAVAGVNGLCAVCLGSGNDRVAAQITLLGHVAADVHCFVTHLHMLGVGVSIGVNRDGTNAHAPRRGGNAACDLAAIGNQNFLEHPLQPVCWLLAEVAWFAR
jgi:hypothetical protein